MKGAGEGRRSAAIAFGLLVASSACSHPDGEKTRRAPALSTAPPLPPDHLETAELAEGDEQAYGIPLPRGYHAVRRFDDRVVADGGETPEAVANYLRRRLDAKSVEIGPTATVFVEAHPKEGFAARTFRVEVLPRIGGSEIIVRDVTPPEAEPGQSEEDRWRKNGLTPDGKILDPKHME